MKGLRYYIVYAYYTEFAVIVLLLIVFMPAMKKSGNHFAEIDCVKEMFGASEKYGITLRDRQLYCAFVESPEGQKYPGTVVSAAIYAFTNK